MKNAQAYSFADHFFFSVETLATVGYWRAQPGDVLCPHRFTAEIFFGMFLTASITALAFSRFATPRANLIFSDVATIAPHESGHMAMTVRIANRRHRADGGYDGAGPPSGALPAAAIRRVPAGLEDLTLVRPRRRVLGLFWPLIHVIDEAAPCSAALGRMPSGQWIC